MLVVCLLFTHRCYYTDMHLLLRWTRPAICLCLCLCLSLSLSLSLHLRQTTTKRHLAIPCFPNFRLSWASLGLRHHSPILCLDLSCRSLKSSQCLVSLVAWQDSRAPCIPSQKGRVVMKNVICKPRPTSIFIITTYMLKRVTCINCDTLGPLQQLMAFACREVCYWVLKVEQDLGNLWKEYCWDEPASIAHIPVVHFM